MFAHERRERILALLDKHRSMEVSRLQHLLGISPATLRRDLAFLDQRERVVRVHGGVCHPSAVAAEPSLPQKAAMSVQAKARIAERVVRDIPEGATVFVDSGSTCLSAGKILGSRNDLTVVTNSLPLAAAFETFRARLIVLGGQMRGVSGALVGGQALGSLGRIRADVALIGASGLHPQDGAGTTELMEASVKREWIGRSRRSLLLADASKWGQAGMVQFAAWNDFDAFYTDQKPPAGFPRRGPQLILA